MITVHSSCKSTRPWRGRRRCIEFGQLLVPVPKCVIQHHDQPPEPPPCQTMGPLSHMHQASCQVLPSIAAQKCSLLHGNTGDAEQAHT